MVSVSLDNVHVLGIILAQLAQVFSFLLSLGLGLRKIYQQSLDKSQHTNVTVNVTDPVVVITPDKGISFIISFRTIKGL